MFKPGTEKQTKPEEKPRYGKLVIRRGSRNLEIGWFRIDPASGLPSSGKITLLPVQHTGDIPVDFLYPIETNPDADSPAT
jgi:hypothetical protein